MLEKAVKGQSGLLVQGWELRPAAADCQDLI